MSQKSTVELCLIALKIDAKFEGKLTCAFKNEMRNLAKNSDIHRLKNNDFILESKMPELNQSKSLEQPDRSDVVCKPYFTLEINE